ncbi:MAG: DUF2147 domain-containing protein [Bacteroidota bacterium]
MKTYLSTAVILLFFLQTLPALSQHPVLGKWHSKGENGEGIIEIFITEEGILHGRLLDALDEEKNRILAERMAEAGATEFLILEHLEQEKENVWRDGTIYSYERDSRYSCKLEFLNDDQVKITAYFLGIFSKSFIWNRWKQ